MERCLISEISCCLNSVLPVNLVHLSKCVVHCSLKAARLYYMISLLNNGNDNRTQKNDPKEENEKKVQYQQHHHHHHHHQEESASSNCEKRKTKDELITCDDIDTVMSSLGIDGWRDVHNQNNDLIQEAHELLDSKNASLDELKEAFYVFDRNEDGFITAFELWSVLRRLEMKEGMSYEDCEEMIRVYDKDGDGRINFSEFKDMMEQAL